MRLGGKDWDDRIVNHVAAQFIKQHGTDPRTAPMALVNLQAAAERAKRTLSKLPQTSITCSHGGRVLTVPLTRAEFETLTKDLLIRTRLTTQQVLSRAKLTWDDIDRILLVGGSTHMPMTGQMLADLTGKTPDNSLAVSEVVARGAAIHAGILTAHEAPRASALESAALDELGQVIEINVNAHSLGIEVKKGSEKINSILIPKNTMLPTAASRVYYTVIENQQNVRVKVLQGDATAAEDCISIGECWIEGLEPFADPGALRRRQQRPDRRDGPGHDERQDGPDRNPPQQRPNRRRDRPRGGVGGRPAHSVNYPSMPLAAERLAESGETRLWYSPSSVPIRSVASTCSSRSMSAARSCTACCARRRSASAAALHHRRKAPKPPRRPASECLGSSSIPGASKIYSPSRFRLWQGCPKGARPCACASSRTAASPTWNP